MDTINNDLTNLLQQMGVHKESLGITQRIVIIAGILIIAFVADYFCTSNPQLSSSASFLRLNVLSSLN